MTRLERLRIDAERCFRLAHGIADWRLSDELEAIGRACEREAEALEQPAAHPDWQIPADWQPAARH